MEIVVLTIGFLGIVSVFFTKQGFLGGGVAVLAFLTYFFIFGTGQWLYLLLFFLGLALIILELFIPSAGLVGVVGFGFLLAGLLFNSASMAATALNLLVAFVLSVVAVLTVLKMGYRFRFGEKFVLRSALGRQEGYRPTGKDYRIYLHQTGSTLTPLRPVGKALIGGDEVEVIAPNSMIDAQQSVTVYRVDGSTLYVRATTNEK